MKNRFIKVTLLLLAGLMLFASCKHEGLPVKDGAVQIEATEDGETVKLAIPVDIYDAMLVNIKPIIEAYNSDKVLSEEDFVKFQAFGWGLYNLDVAEAKEYKDEIKEDLSEIFSAEDANKVLKAVLKLSEPEQEILNDCFELISNLLDPTLEYLEELIDLKNGDSLYDSKAELLKEFKEDYDYKLWMQLFPQFFPSIEIVAK